MVARRRILPSFFLIHYCIRYCVFTFDSRRGAKSPDGAFFPRLPHLPETIQTMYAAGLGLRAVAE